jgi:hypothetical protein
MTFGGFGRFRRPEPLGWNIAPCDDAWMAIFAATRVGHG